MTTDLQREGLERKFSTIEKFLATFPKDIAIEEASVELVAATLKAIEDAIGFFLQKKSEFNEVGILTAGPLILLKSPQSRKLSPLHGMGKSTRRRHLKASNRSVSAVSSCFKRPTNRTSQIPNRSLIWY